MAKSPPPKQSSEAPRLPPAQVCGKCEAEFSWEPSNPAVKGSPLIARLSKPSGECDCGYGSLPPALDF